MARRCLEEAANKPTDTTRGHTVAQVRHGRECDCQGRLGLAKSHHETICWTSNRARHGRRVHHTAHHTFPTTSRAQRERRTRRASKAKPRARRGPLRRRVCRMPRRPRSICAPRSGTPLARYITRERRVVPRADPALERDRSRPERPRRPAQLVTSDRTRPMEHRSLRPNARGLDLAARPGGGHRARQQEAVSRALR